MSAALTSAIFVQSTYFVCGFMKFQGSSHEKPAKDSNTQTKRDFLLLQAQPKKMPAVSVSVSCLISALRFGLIEDSEDTTQ